MDQQKIEKINDVLGNKIFYYTGPIFYGDDENYFPFEYKIKIGKEKQMISVGEWKDYVTVEVDIVKLLNRNGLVDMSTFNEHPEIFAKLFTTKNFVLTNHIIQHIRGILKHFDFKNIIITDINISNSETNINESKMYRSVVRDVIRDVVNVIKSDLHATKVTKLGYYGEGDNKFKVILKQNLSDEEKLLKPVDVTGYWDEEDKVIEIEIDVDENSGNEVLFEIIGELNDIVRHELEHQRQYLDDYDFPSKEYKQPLRYYTQPHEIEAQIAGFKRLAKLQKKPLDTVMMDFFQKRKGKYNLSNTTIKKIIDRIKEYGKI
jgi:hypothetical protein